MKSAPYVTNSEYRYIDYDKDSVIHHNYIYPTKEGVCHCNDCDCNNCENGCLQPPDDCLDYSIDGITDRISNKINNTPVDYCEG